MGEEEELTTKNTEHTKREEKKMEEKEKWVKPGFTATQAQFERFFEVLNERKVVAEEMSAARYAGELVRAADDPALRECALR